MQKNCIPAFGIIAEYNPLHNGHSQMMAAARSALGDAPCVIVLSPSFTQRGEPAICDKWTRAKMALQCGADLVLELPFIFSCAAAPDFAAGAVGLLARTHLVSHLAFGMETPDVDVDPILDILLNEPQEFSRALQNELKRGASYPKAASIAIDTVKPGCGAFMSSPNNMLAISYMLDIKKRGCSIVPLPLPRLGGSHNGLTLDKLAGSGAIRAALNDGASLDDGELLAEAVPSSSLLLLREARDEGRLMSYNKKNETLWTMLRALFLRSSSEELRCVDGMDEGIENLFMRNWRDAENYGDFVGRCVSARYTQGYIRRRLVRILLGINRWDACAVRRFGAPYAHVLGFTARGRELIKEHRRDSEIPFITRLAAAEGPIGELAARMEFGASVLYEMLLPRPDIHREERGKPMDA